jgi:hypothetical protein
MFLIRTRGVVTRRALLASALGAAWLSVGCDDSKSDGQIPAAPEAANAAQEASKSISGQMAKKYNTKR